MQNHDSLTSIFRSSNVQPSIFCPQKRANLRSEAGGWDRWLNAVIWQLDPRGSLAQLKILQVRKMTAKRRITMPVYKIYLHLMWHLTFFGANRYYFSLSPHLSLISCFSEHFLSSFLSTSSTPSDWNSSPVFFPSTSFNSSLSSHFLSASSSSSSDPVELLSSELESSLDVVSYLWP